MICGRFQVLRESGCFHLPIFYGNFGWLLSLASVPVAVGFANASAFGNAAVQIFVLMIVLNYGRTTSSYLTQPLSAGIFVAGSLANLGKKHPTKDIPLIDYRLALMILPNLITGLVAGIHLKQYVPKLLLTFFFVFQLLVLIMNTQKTYKQRKLLELTQAKVKAEAPEEKLNILKDNEISLDDGVYLDFNRIFTLISKSPNKEIYLKHLPQELRDLKLEVEQEQKQIQEYLVQQFGKEKLERVQQKLEQEQKQLTNRYLIGIVLLVILNLLVLYIKGYQISDKNQPGCQGNYWSAFGILFFFNSALYFYLAQRKNGLNETLKLWIVSFLGGFSLGVIGLGVALFLVVSLVKMNASVGGFPSIGATLPILLAGTTMTGSLIQVIIGGVDLISTLVFLIFGFLGQYKINPIATQILKRKQILRQATKAALFFQVLLLIGYIGLQLPKIIRTPLIEQLTPQPYCI